MTRFVVALVVFLAFAIYSVAVTLTHGYFSFLEVPLQGGWALQITLDLVVAASVASMWLVSDAKTHGLSPWPYVALVFPLGSIGLLAYLVAREWKIARTPSFATA
ncbi:MAG: hypothetical protein ACK6CU_25585 [Deltaproteobacteria bacterium]|jgi:hypothetical protein